MLDLTRLVSRLGRGPLTGVDRVEMAYLEALLGQPAALFALVRTGAGFVLLDRNGAAGVAALVRGERALGPADLLGRLTRRGAPLCARAEATVRRLALARCPVPLLGRMLRRHLAAGVRYLNVGHANLSDSVMVAVRRVPGAKIAVLMHDTIPLDYPEFTRAGIPAVFGRKLAVVARHADRVIFSSEDARARALRHFARAGRVPEAIVAALGVPVPVPGVLPAGLDASVPYFVALGTIEPRKNHALLLDMWQALAERGGPLPKLYVVGARGWADRAVLDRLDAGVAGVVEVGGLGDGAVAALLQGARALLFPTLAEGFGLPPVEAAALGVPVVCSNLPVLYEILGDYPVYVATSDLYAWTETILGLAGGPGPGDGAAGRVREPPGWADHFRKVLTAV